MKTYYECHITIQSTHVERVREAVQREKWKFSVIDGDPTLGDGVKCYATMHYNARLPEEEVLRRLHEVADRLAPYRVIRRKIERVIYDDRSSTVRCDGGCPECHLDDVA